MKKSTFLPKIIILYFFITASFAIEQQNFLSKGIELYNKKQFKESKILFEKSLVFNPKSEQSYLYLAKIFSQNGTDDQQEINLNNVLLLDPQNDEALYMLILLKVEQSDYNLSRELIDRFNLVCKSFCSKKKELSKAFKKITPNNEKSNN